MTKKTQSKPEAGKPAAHTPGPWEAAPAKGGRAGAWIVTGPGLCYIAAVDDAQEDDNADNARLIAAAPDLLASCRELEEVLTKANDLGDEYEWDPIEEAKRLRAAILKATGAR